MEPVPRCPSLVSERQDRLRPGEEPARSKVFSSLAAGPGDVLRFCSWTWWVLSGLGGGAPQNGLGASALLDRGGGRVTAASLSDECPTEFPLRTVWAWSLCVGVFKGQIWFM